MIVAGGRLVTPSGIRDADLHVEGGRIVRIEPWARPGTPDVVDATGLLVLPGAVDAHVHGREPGFPDKETFETMTGAAAAGGVTTVIDMPNTMPATATAELFAAKLAQVSERAQVDFALWGMLRASSTPEDVAGLAAAGAAGIKAYLGYAVRKSTGQVLYSPAILDADLEPPASYGTIARLGRALAESGIPVAAHAEDPSILLSSGTRVDGYESLLEARPDLAEAVAVAALGALAVALSLPLHVVHLSSAAGLAAALAARAAGARISLETCPQYLYLTDADYGRLGPVMKMYPLIRTAADREALRAALLEGLIDTVGTDHAPHTDEEKLHHPLAEAHAGSPGVQTLLLSCLHLGGPERAARWTAQRPAEVFGLAAKGAIEVGRDADLVLVDPAGKTRVDIGWQRSRQRHAALDGLEFDYAIRAVYLRGEAPAAGRGRFVRPGAGTG
ncbi:MAG: allantoinase [Candidatus Dormibacteraceae bacterium]